MKAILTQKISEITSSLSETNLNHPTKTLISISNVLPESDFLNYFGPQIEALFRKRVHSAFIVNLVKDRVSLRPIYTPILLETAGSSDFATANSFSNAVDSLDVALGEILSDEQSLQLIVAIMKAANWGAWSAKAKASSKFAEVPILRSKAITFINANEKAAAALIQDSLGETKPMSEFVSANLEDEEE